MFGYLPAPCRCQIGDQTGLYRSAFCGLCNALARQYGPPARLLINRDSTFVALLAAAQQPVDPAAARSTRCQPWSRPMPVFEDGPATAYAAAVTLCGLQAKLDDERVDESRLRAIGCGLLAALSHTRFNRAQAVLAASDFPVGSIRRQLAEQSYAEARVAAGSDPNEAAQPSACAFGSILAHTARLAGSEANVEPLYEAGRSLGTLVYTLDAYQDLADDCRRGRFNFLAADRDSGPSHVDQAIRDRARAIVSRCQTNLRQAWQEVELARYRPVLEAVVLTGLSSRTQRILAAPSGPWLASDEDGLSEDDGAGYTDQSAASCGPSGDCAGCCYCCDCLECDSDGCCCDGDCGGSDCNCCDCGGGDCSGCDCGGCDCSG